MTNSNTKIEAKDITFMLYKNGFSFSYEVMVLISLRVLGYGGGRRE